MNRTLITKFTERIERGDHTRSLEEVINLIHCLNDENLQVDILNILDTYYGIFGYVDCTERLYCEDDWGDINQVSMPGIEVITDPFLSPDEIKEILITCEDIKDEEEIEDYLSEFFEGYEVPYECADWCDAEGGDRAYSREDL